MSNKSNAIDVGWLSQQIGRPSIYNISHKILALVEAGKIKPGMRLPPIRVLAKALNISSTTVVTAFNELKARNVIHSKQGVGTVVIENPVTEFPLRLKNFTANDKGQSPLDLSYSNPDYCLLPKLNKAMNYAINNTRLTDIRYCPIIKELKEAILSSWPYPAESFMVLNNAFEAITLLLRLFVPPNAYVAIENPATIDNLDILRRSNCRIIGVNCDQKGPIIDSLAKALSQKPVLFIYQPREHIATGNVVSSQRMADIAALFKSYKAKTLVVEHDIIGDLSHFPAYSLGRYLTEKTVHIRSYAKSYNTDLCFIALSAADSIIQRLYNYRICSLGTNSQILQQALTYLLRDEKTQLTIQHAKTRYNQRYCALLEALKKRQVYLPYRHGLHLFLWLPVNSERQALMLLESQGIIAIGGSHFMVTQAQSSKQYIRIMTSCLSTPHLINQVADAIAFVKSKTRSYRFLNDGQRQGTFAHLTSKFLSRKPT